MLSSHTLSITIHSQMSFLMIDTLQPLDSDLSQTIQVYTHYLKTPISIVFHFLYYDLRMSFSVFACTESVFESTLRNILKC
jgi:hypothetical protein